MKPWDVESALDSLEKLTGAWDLGEPCRVILRVPAGLAEVATGKL